MKIWLRIIHGVALSFTIINAVMWVHHQGAFRGWLMATAWLCQLLIYDFVFDLTGVPKNRN